MLKYEVGQEFKTNRDLKFPNDYGSLEKGATFKITYSLEDGELAHPYIIEFENRYEIAVSDKEIDELKSE